MVLIKIFYIVEFVNDKVKIIKMSNCFVECVNCQMRADELYLYMYNNYYIILIDLYINIVGYYVDF